MTRVPIPGGIPDGRMRKLHPKDWLTIIALAQDGRAVGQIAAQFAVDSSVIYKGLRKRQVNITAIAQRLAREEADKQKTDLVNKIKDSKKSDYDFTRLIQNEIIGVIADARKKSQPIGDRLNDIKALKIAIEGIRMGTDNKWRILGLDKENEDADALLPELPITEMSQEEVEQMRTNQEATAGLTEEEIELLGVEVEPIEIEDDEIVEEE